MSSDDLVEDLPSPIAWATARAAPLEHPTTSACAAVLVTFTELAVVRVLAEALHAPEALPFSVESAMRLVMLEEMEAEGWLDLYAALEHSGLIELLGLPAELPPVVRDAMREVGANELVDWLDHARSKSSEGAVAATCALTRVARGWSDLPLCYVRSVRENGDGFEVESRRLVGTAWPGVRRTPHVERPPVEADQLTFWDGGDTAIAVPSWLLRWDEATTTLRLFTGRSAANGQWRYADWCGHRASAPTSELAPVVPGLPPFLVESAWSSHGEVRLDPNEQTQLIAKGGSRGDGRSATPTPTGTTTRSATPIPAAVAENGAQLAIRVVTGPDLMRYLSLEPGDRVVVGRNSAAASFVLDHHQLSRSHTEIVVSGGRVKVRDLGSTNGTQVQGRTIPGGEALPVEPGSWIGLGAVLLRLEWLTRERRERLDAMQELRSHGDERDPSTLLLRASALAERLPRALRASFRDGGAAPGAPALWGVLLYVDRLAAIHAQHGERIADRVFRDVARVLQYEVESPGNWVRVGYGEMLYPYVGMNEVLVRSEAERLCEVIAAHPWETPIDRLSLSASIGPKDPAESAQEWLKRLRTELREGRSRGTKLRTTR